MTRVHPAYFQVARNTKEWFSLDGDAARPSPQLFLFDLFHDNFVEGPQCIAQHWLHDLGSPLQWFCPVCVILFLEAYYLLAFRLYFVWEVPRKYIAVFVIYTLLFPVRPPACCIVCEFVFPVNLFGRCESRRSHRCGERIYWKFLWYWEVADLYIFKTYLEIQRKKCGYREKIIHKP